MKKTIVYILLIFLFISSVAAITWDPLSLSNLRNKFDSIYASITDVKNWIGTNSTSDRTYTDTRVDSIDNHTATVDTTIGNETARVDLIIGTYIPNNSTADRSYTDTRVDSIENFTMQGINDSLGNWSLDRPNYPTNIYVSDNYWNKTESYNKSEVDDLTSATAFDFFMTNDTSDLTGMFNFSELDKGRAENSLDSISLSTGNDQSIFNWTTSSLPFNVLRTGIYNVHVHFQRTAGNKDVTITPVLYNISLDGTQRDILITFQTSTAITNTNLVYDLKGTLSSELEIPNNRLMLELQADVPSGGTSTTITVFMEGTTDSHLTVETTSASFDNIFIRKDGQNSPTATIDWGGFNLINAPNLQLVAGAYTLTNFSSDYTSEAGRYTQTNFTADRNTFKLVSNNSDINVSKIILEISCFDGITCSVNESWNGSCLIRNTPTTQDKQGSTC